jgi:hypothetical protein
LVILLDDHLQRFLKWQTSIEKGRTDKEASQHCQQVSRIWRNVCPEMTLPGLLNVENLRDRWLEEVRTEWAPGTVRSYFGNIFVV